MNVPFNCLQGVTYLTKGCDLNNGNACFYLSGMFISGVDSATWGLHGEQTPSEPPKKPAPNAFSLARDMNKAFSLSMKACELKNFYACANLSQMYATGSGVEKNLDKAEHYKQQYYDLRDEYKRKEVLSRFKHPRV